MKYTEFDIAAQKIAALQAEATVKLAQAIESLTKELQKMRSEIPQNDA